MGILNTWEHNMQFEQHPQSMQLWVQAACNATKLIFKKKRKERQKYELDLNKKSVSLTVLTELWQKLLKISQTWRTGSGFFSLFFLLKARYIKLSARAGEGLVTFYYFWMILDFSFC